MRCTTRPTNLLALSAGLLLGLPASALAQESVRTAVTAAGARYRAGPLHRFILGRHYRDLWTQPIEVDVLDLQTYAGGLEPLRTGGGRQTRSLRFLGGDGREYAFRGVDKDPSAVLDSLLRETVVDDLVQDGISAAHPFGALVAAPLLDAAGILHVDPVLRVMPDDPRLGPFREEFAGMLGMIEERPDENTGERASFQGTALVISSERLTERLANGPLDSTIDAEAFLTARLMDVFLGDWDRHRGQWRWATYDDDEPRTWLPVPRDRDQAFSKFDGLATRIVSLYMPQFVRFEEEYPSITRLHWNARALDRWFLAGLERPAWDSVGRRLQAALTDEVIEEAVSRLPPEIHALNGEELTVALRSRRDALDEAWDDFYRLIARNVDVQLTDAAEVVVVDRTRPGNVLVTAALPGRAQEHFRRRFLEEETDEVRVHLAGGDDRVRFLGDADADLRVRVIGGAGDDVFELDAERHAVRLYDAEGNNSVSGSDPPSLDTDPFDAWVWSEEDRDQPREWGTRALPIFWSSFSSDLGPFVGGGARVETYAFRKRPYAAGFDLRGGYAPVLGKWRFEIDGRLHRENSPLYWTLGSRVSRLDVIHYYGAGNNTSPAGSSSFHEVDQTVASFRLGFGVTALRGLELNAGVAIERLSTRDASDRFYGTLGSPYGGGRFVQLGATAGFVADPLAGSTTTGSRIRVAGSATAFPDLFDVARAFGRTDFELSTLLASSVYPTLSLALRGGGVGTWGRIPWHQSAFLGGTSSLRGWDEQRFAGDASLFGSGELRLRIWRPRVVVPVSLGLFGFGDAGRVFVDGSSPGGWHTGIGGGVWMQPVRQPYIVRAGVGVGDEATKLFVLLGLPY